MAETSADEAAPRHRVADDVGALQGVPFVDSHGDEVYFPSREQYVEVASALRESGFAMCADLCGVDYLTFPDRALPERVAGTRFEVVCVFRSLEPPRVVRLRVPTPDDDLACPTLYGIYPGVENMEREVYDMFGVRFPGHPDPTRILMPEDWEGHPLRRDYGVGRVPVQFKGAPGPR
jgi:NADH-quinone oxidoreductase subunit C